MTTSIISRLGASPEEGIKAPVKAVSSGNLALFDAGMSIAGYVVQDSDRICVNGQTDSTENGIYVARLGRAWTRATDMNNSDDVQEGQLVVDENTGAVYTITVSAAPWQPGIGTVAFGLVLTPVGFFWGAIGGTLSNQGDLQTALDAKAALAHTHVEADITDLQAYILDAAGSIGADGEFYGRTNGAWVALPATLPPSAHTHVEADITDLQTYLLDSPSDGNFYARMDGAWSMVSTAAGTTGEIVAWPHEDVPQNFLACNGQSVNAVTFADLFAVVGYRYGGSGANFNLPDLRGEFIRGWANGSGNDPDRTSRTDSGDGSTGDVVGTKQDHAFAQHTHGLTRSLDDGSQVSIFDGGNNTRLASGQTGNSSTGGSETRPRNVYMQYIIRYAGGGSSGGGGGGGAAVWGSITGTLTDQTDLEARLGTWETLPVYSNLVAGNGAGAALTTAADSIFIGSNAGNKVTSADRNVFIGYLAGNTATSSFGRNVAVGANALENTDTGFYNVCLGQDAGQNLATSSAYNICIGPGAGPSGATTESTKLYIHDGPGTPLIGGDFGAGEVTMSAETGNFDLYLNTVQSAKLQSIIFQDGGSNRGRLYHSHNAANMYFHILALNTTSVSSQIILKQTGGVIQIQTGGSNGVTAQDNVVFSGLGNTTGVATFTGKINTFASGTSRAAINLPHGTAPTSPVDGDMWTTTAGLYVRINGSTVGPLS